MYTNELPCIQQPGRIWGSHAWFILGNHNLVKFLHVFCDSQVVVQQANKEYTINDENLKKYVDMALQYKALF